MANETWIASFDNHFVEGLAPAVYGCVDATSLGTEESLQARWLMREKIACIAAKLPHNAIKDPNNPFAAKLTEAITFALQNLPAKCRKTMQVPIAYHSLDVTNILLATAPRGEDNNFALPTAMEIGVIAATLHDVVEDAEPLNRANIENGILGRFGQDVHDVVMSLTKQVDGEGKEEADIPYFLRNIDKVDRLELVPLITANKFGDYLSNFADVMTFPPEKIAKKMAHVAIFLHMLIARSAFAMYHTPELYAENPTAMFNWLENLKKTFTDICVEPVGLIRDSDVLCTEFYAHVDRIRAELRNNPPAAMSIHEPTFERAMSNWLADPTSWHYFELPSKDL